ncbi:PilZ domain-containing protein [Anaeromyxobacter paludicola]|uniref:PilZ domain-containing protein n=1 Tax=Anaeromyxobacter paludicola TaxID=2918171 RepID=A0ABM7X7P5_9BACT|nr:PilZ domain-containing protein [Anaeromyxobacter paludicola]BDG07861.1 hypothetical protein AMPC_09740 [Anaeromyxobacter paludicola]
MSSLAEWLAAFRQLHDKARKQHLTERERAVYLSGRDELARAVIAAQRLSTVVGQTPRQALRIARALQVDLDWSVGSERAMTLDLSVGGFGALLAKPPPSDEDLKFSLRIPGADPVAGRARVVDVKVQPGNARVCFAFVGLGAAELERLELFMFDALLTQLAG